MSLFLGIFFTSGAIALATAYVVKIRRNSLPTNVQPPFPRVLSEVSMNKGSGKWIRTKIVTYVDDHGVARLWEKVERTTTHDTTDVDGVLVLARIQGGSRDGCIPFVTQFRPAIGKKTIELPAGLIDKGETPEVAAIRELKEETGLIGKACSVSPILYLDPGMSSSSMRVVECVVDGTDPRNIAPAQTLEAGEFCQVLYLKKPNKQTFEELGNEYALETNIMWSCLAQN